MLTSESLGLARQIGDKSGTASALHNLGAVLLRQGDYQRAKSLAKHSLAAFRELKNKRNIAMSLNNLGECARRAGDNSRAGPVLVESLVLFHDTGDRVNTAINLEGLAAVFSSTSKSEQAARLFGAASAVREDAGAPLPAHDRDDYERNLRVTRAALGENGFASAWQEGTEMTLEEAVTYAVQAATDDPPSRSQVLTDC
jgi:tetratricopeptide (TPR) repeat protein